MLNNSPRRQFIRINDEVINLDHVVYVDLKCDNGNVELTLAHSTGSYGENTVQFTGEAARALRAFFYDTISYAVVEGWSKTAVEQVQHG
jgi:hypothetical protein